MAKITQTAGRNALGEFAPEFAHFNDDVLFGENWNNQDIDVKTRKVWTVNEGDLPYEDKAMRAHAKEMVFPIGTPNNGFAQYFSGSLFAPCSFKNSTSRNPHVTDAKACAFSVETRHTILPVASIFLQNTLLYV